MTRRGTIGISGLLAAALFLSLRIPFGSPGDQAGPDAAPSGGTESLACEEGGRAESEPWGKAGYSRGCYRDGLPHGRWTYWEKGYLNLEGFFKNGRKHGAWTVFNEDGTIYVKIFFEEGQKRGKRFY